MITYTLFFPLMFASYQPPSHQYGVAVAHQVCADIDALGVDWFYNWHYSSSCDGQVGAEFVPMIWGIHMAGYASELSPGGWLMGPNEPNYKGQAVASPEAVAAIWPQLEATGHKLVSPAVSACESRHDPNCLDPLWLEKWVAACQGCEYEAIALHWYGCNVDELIAYLDKRRAQFPGKQLWLTEFACSGLWHQYYPETYPTPEQFLLEALPEIQKRVDRYAPYATRPPEWYFTPLVADDGGLTQLGQIYRNN